MSIEFRPATCGMCRKHWKRTSLSTHSGNPLNVVTMFGEGATQGFVCEKCNLFICELCFLKTNRRCFFCGDQNCVGVWIESLTQSEQQMYRDFKRHILIHIVSGIVWVIATGVVGSFINPNIPLEKSVGISVATVLLMLGLVRIMRGLSPFDKKSAIIVGFFSGASRVLALGQS